MIPTLIEKISARNGVQWMCVGWWEALSCFLAGIVFVLPCGLTLRLYDDVYDRNRSCIRGILLNGWDGAAIFRDCRKNITFRTAQVDSYIELVLLRVLARLFGRQTIVHIRNICDSRLR